MTLHDGVSFGGSAKGRWPDSKADGDDYCNAGQTHNPNLMTSVRPSVDMCQNVASHVLVRGAVPSRNRQWNNQSWDRKAHAKLNSRGRKSVRHWGREVKAKRMSRELHALPHAAGSRWARD